MKQVFMWFELQENGTLTKAGDDVMYSIDTDGTASSFRLNGMEGEGYFSKITAELDMARFLQYNKSCDTQFALLRVYSA